MSNHHNAQSGTDQTIARRHNRAQILNRLRLQGSVSRASLAKQTGLTRSTISRIVDELIAENLVEELDSVNNGRGRPSISLSLNPQGGAAIGLEIGVNFISILLTDFLAKPLWRERITLPEKSVFEDYVSNSEALIENAIRISKEHDLPLMGIGLAIWGLVSYDKNLIHLAPNLNWRDVTLGQKWESLYGVPVVTENDANASALGEYYFGAGKKMEDFIYLSIDVGVGSGIISKGKLFRGAEGYAGEFGHITIDPNGKLCSCGKRGCLETVVGRRIIVNRYRELTGNTDVTLESIISNAENGDEIAMQVFDEVGEDLGFGIGQAINILNPKGVILGWSLGQAYPFLISGIERGLVKSSLPDLRENIKIIPSINGSDDALFGCVALILDEIIRETIF